MKVPEYKIIIERVPYIVQNKIHIIFLCKKLDSNYINENNNIHIM